MVFSAPAFDDHEKVVFGYDKATGLKAIIAIHRKGPKGRALGGCRMVDYKSEEDALNDVLRLSRGMTFKSAVSGLALGGAKSVIMGDPAKKTPELLRAMGKFVDSLGGAYYTSVDVGISAADVDTMSSVTPYAVPGGDPSPMTALGVYQGMKAAAKAKLGTDDLKGKRVAIQGIGKVGYGLAEYLAKEGAEIFVADVNAAALDKAAKDLGAQVVDLDAIWDQDVEIIAPCALGASVNDETIARMKASVIAGGANNQLAHDGLAEVLKGKGVLYAPDYVINAGGVIQVDSHVDMFSEDEVRSRTMGIYDTLLRIFDRAERDNITTLKAAEDEALARMNAALAEAAE
ncbi:MAG: amino acid dehydrogenase [Alphaproteobacteria bacterium]|nr:MAG: amino acid dehydrogenase [Alphaproteobacteria bacterium]